MKKAILSIVCILCITFTACSNGVQSLNFDSFVKEDGKYGFPTVEFGDSFETVAEKMKFDAKITDDDITYTGDNGIDYKVIYRGAAKFLDEECELGYFIVDNQLQATCVIFKNRDITDEEFVGGLYAKCVEAFGEPRDKNFTSEEYKFGEIPTVGWSSGVTEFSMSFFESDKINNKVWVMVSNSVYAK